MTNAQMQDLKAGRLTNREIYGILEGMSLKPKLRSQALMEEQLIKALLTECRRKAPGFSHGEVQRKKKGPGLTRAGSRIKGVVTPPACSSSR